MSWDALEAAWAKIQSSVPKHAENYFGCYSSWLGGFFREPGAMFVPLDDHGFHRGDGVFEAARICDHAYIDFAPHMERLERSAAAIGLELPRPRAEIGEICLELGRRVKQDRVLKDGILRLYVTRGPGGFGPAPTESVGAQIFAAITAMKAPDDALYAKGVRACVTKVEAKAAPWSIIKSLNYLQNVMMKQETVKRGFDYGLSFDDQGHVCEGATENFVIVSGDDELLVPKFDYTLRGTTVRTAMRLAERWEGADRFRQVRLADLSLKDIHRAKEAAFVGTTIGVLPVASLDDYVFPGRGRLPKLSADLRRAIAEDADLRTPF